MASFEVCGFCFCCSRFWIKGLTVGVVVTVGVFMGASSCWAVALAVALEWASGRYIHAERLLAKVGGSNCKGRGISHTWNGAQREWKVRSAAEGCTSEARKPGDTPCGRGPGQSPPSVLVVACFCRRGVAGRVDLPAEVGDGGPKGRRQGGNLIPLAMNRLASRLGSTAVS